MTNEEEEAWREKETADTNYRRKLVEARERKGLSVHDAAQLMNYQIGSGYYDIEDFEGDLTGCYSLQEVLSICEKLEIHPRDLFCDQACAKIPISKVIEKIRSHCTEKKLSVGEFEDIAGWRVESSLIDPTKAVEEWSIDCLMNVCREVEIDWQCVVAGL